MNKYVLQSKCIQLDCTSTTVFVYSVFFRKCFNYYVFSMVLIKNYKYDLMHSIVLPIHMLNFPIIYQYKILIPW